MHANSFPNVSGILYFFVLKWCWIIHIYNSHAPYFDSVNSHAPYFDSVIGD